MHALLVYGTGWLSAGLIVAAIPGPLFNRLLTRLGLRPRGGLYRWHFWLGGSAAVVAMMHRMESLLKGRPAKEMSFGR